jgi:hypothetical protein
MLPEHNKSRLCAPLWTPHSPLDSDIKLAGSFAMRYPLAPAGLNSRYWMKIDFGGHDGSRLPHSELMDVWRDGVEGSQKRIYRLSFKYDDKARPLAREDQPDQNMVRQSI